MFNLRSGLYMNPATVLTTGCIKEFYTCTTQTLLLIYQQLLKCEACYACIRVNGIISYFHVLLIIDNTT